jgi:two-component system, LytTR family, response regulator
MIRCLVIDDEPYARELLREFIAKLPNLKFEGAYSSALGALPALNKKAIDVIFLDIQMPDISGIDFLKTLDKRPCVIFTTAFAEYALEGFELDVVDYLLKPFDFNRFLKAVNKLTLRMEKSIPGGYTVEKNQGRADFIFVKDGNKLVKVELKSILFIKGTREYVTIHTRNKKIMSLQTLKNLELELPPEFIRVHNSYIVFIPSVGIISKNEVEIEGETIPIGITYKKNFLERIKTYFPGKDFGE